MTLQAAARQGNRDPESDVVEGWALEASRGDADALGLLYERYADPVYRMVYLRVRDVAVAEDIAAQTWLKACRSIRDYKPRGAGFPAWIMTIARNTLRDSRRDFGRHPEIPTEDMLVLDEQTDSRDGPEAAAEAAELGRILARALHRLPGNQSRCLTLRFYAGLTIDETAAVMGMSRENVRKLQYRGTRGLAKLVRNPAVLDPDLLGLLRGAENAQNSGSTVRQAD